MILNKIKITNYQIVKDYFMKKNPLEPISGNIKNILNPCIIYLELSDLSQLEAMGFKIFSNNRFTPFEYYKTNDMESKKDNYSTEYFQTMEKLETLSNSINKKNQISIFETYAPQILIRYSGSVVFEGINIFNFIGTDIEDIFKLSKDEEECENKLFEAMYASLYKGLLTLLSYSSISRDINTLENESIESFMEDRIYSRIDDSSIIMPDFIYGTNREIFNFIDNDGNINETMMSGIRCGIFSNRKIVFLLNTTFSTFVKLFLNGVVYDHQPLKDVIYSSNYRVIVDNITTYQTRIEQVLSELHSEREYQFNQRKLNSLGIFEYMPNNNTIKYRIVLTLDELNSFKGFNMNNEIISDLKEISLINATIEQAKKVLINI